MVADGNDGTGWDGTQLDVQRRRIGVQQPAQRCDRGSGAVELVLKSPQVARDRVGALLRIVRGEDGPELDQGTLSCRSRWINCAVGIWSGR
ncbi:hypothetical protein GCM10027290_44250 [Micromonospora sonneratiae]